MSNNKDVESLRKYYIDNPPDGMSPEEISKMCDDDLLDMDYFLNEDNPFAFLFFD